jgi:hypothetical protein
VYISVNCDGWECNLVMWFLQPPRFLGEIRLATNIYIGHHGSGQATRDPASPPRHATLFAMVLHLRFSGTNLWLSIRGIISFSTRPIAVMRWTSCVQLNRSRLQVSVVAVRLPPNLRKQTTTKYLGYSKSSIYSLSL